ncbi:hypothetical protein GWI33_003276, partial [Rhynchophorus ferrugineus]
EYAYPIQQVTNANKHRLSYASLRKQLEAHWFKSNVQDYLNILSSSLSFDTWFNQNLSLNWVNAVVVKDSADKIRETAPREQHLNFQLTHILDHPVEKVDLVSAYFVPDENSMQIMQDLSNQDVQIRVLTNSFKANDVPLVHAFYAKHRPQMLANGIQLYEFLPVLPNNLIDDRQKSIFQYDQNSRKKNSKDGFSRSSLHAKFMALDNRQVFIGSFNFDPRSAYLNTEIGVILDSPTLAKAIHNSMDQDLIKYSYHVSLDPTGQMIWKQQTPNGQKIYSKEPEIKWWQKIGLKLVSWLPIQGQM